MRHKYFFSRLIYALSLIILIGLGVLAHVFFKNTKNTICQNNSFRYTPYVYVDPVESKLYTKTWIVPECQKQEQGWVYDIFNPPKIIHHALLDTFFANPIDITAGCGNDLQLNLLTLTPKLYPFILEGYIEGPEGYIFFIHHIKNKETFRVKLGHTICDFIKIESFDPPKWDSLNQLFIPPVLRVYDIQFQKYFELCPGLQASTDLFDIHIGIQNSTTSLVFEKEGQYLSSVDGTFTLKKIYFQHKTILIEYKAPNALHSECLLCSLK